MKNSIKLTYKEISPTKIFPSIVSKIIPILQAKILDKLSELDLLPKNFNFSFNFWSNRRESGKGIDRLCTLLIKAVHKKFPFASNSITQLFTVGSGSGFTVSLVSDSFMCNSQIIGESLNQLTASEILRSGYFTLKGMKPLYTPLDGVRSSPSRFFRKVCRYVYRINKKTIRNKIPIYLRITSATIKPELSFLSSKILEKDVSQYSSIPGRLYITIEVSFSAIFPRHSSIMDMGVNSLDLLSCLPLGTATEIQKLIRGIEKKEVDITKARWNYSNKETGNMNSEEINAINKYKQLSIKTDEEEKEFLEALSYLQSPEFLTQYPLRDHSANPNFLHPSNPNVKYKNPFQDFFLPERLFFIIPDILKCMYTAVRLTSYDNSVFRIGACKGPSAG